MENALHRDEEAIRREADGLLDAGGLRALLGRYGTVHAAGSYALRLMTWRDLDLYLETPGMSVAEFFALGGKIAELLRPVKMFYDNHLIGDERPLPRGLYWGVRLGDLAQGAWKIDIWAVDPEERRRLAAFTEQLAARLTPEARTKILSIKYQFCRHPAYRKSFAGITVYRAVLDDGVETSEEFLAYLQERDLIQAL